MKKLLTIVILLTLCFTGYSQESNKELLKKAETELNLALEKEDYENAAKIKKEIEIRKKIETAILEGNYEAAAQLKKELNGGGTSIEVQKTEVKETGKIEELNISSSLESMGFVKPSSNKAAVYFVRKNIYATSMRMNIFDGEQFVGGAVGGTYMRYECTPGKHMFWSWSEFNNHKVYLPATLEAGKVYIIQISASRTTSKERKLSGKSMREYIYTLHIKGIKPQNKRQEQLVSFVRNRSSRSYPEKVIRRLNSEYELEIKDAVENFTNKHTNQELEVNDFVPEILLQ